MKETILQVNDLTIKFGGITAVDNVHIKAVKGEITSVIGPNGAGKTTLFNMISGIYKPTSGTVQFGGRDITGKSSHMISREGIARTFQNIRLYQGLSVVENVQAVLDARTDYNIIQALLGLPSVRQKDRENVEKSKELLKIVGLYDLRDEKPSNLPYGLQRKLEIARALATAPKLLLLDEPGAGLNTKEVDELIALVREVQERFKMSVLLIEHRLQMVYSLSDKVYVLNFGKLLAEGTPKEVQNDERVVAAYMGEDD